MNLTVTELAEMDTLRRRVDSLEARVKTLEAGHEEIVELPELGPFEIWLASDDCKPYAGKSVAFVAGKGVIASADSLDELDGLVEDAPEIVYGFVPAGDAWLR